MADNEMAAFGLSSTEEELYRHFLRNPGTSADDAHLILRTADADAARALERLCELGVLLTSGPGGGVVPAEPEQAVSRLTDRRLHELHRDLRRVTRSRHVVDGLRAEQGARTAAPQGIEQIEGLAAIRGRIEDLAFFAREEVLSVEPCTRSCEDIAHSRPLDLRCLARGVTVRNVVHSSALSDPPTAAYLRELAAAGAHIRVADEGDAGEQLLVYDRRTVLVPLDPRDTARGALLAHKSGLVANIIALFERIWSQAAPLDTVLDQDAPSPLSEMERQVLLAMCTVGKDEAGARELGVSVRTYRRHIADLMQLLGAASRVQAALLARERGWV
ncbi:MULTISPECIES: LuxR C-terminal-related transcriptional regulator [Streptomyces]|uniref:LuxR C-terminal-related transcriptional regulator n=1 Tax=Streptomyces TaxID=1883 RepID=UPI0036540810